MSYKENFAEHQGLCTFANLFCEAFYKCTPIPYHKIGRQMSLNRMLAFVLERMPTENY